MCTVCGCAGEGATIERPAVRGHPHHHGHGHDHHHDHDHDHGGLHSHAPGLSPARMVRIEQDILAKNNAYAARNRAFLAARGILALNLLSSPGSGKTSLLVRTIEKLAGGPPVSVIEGDQATANDADRIRATGVPALQINTGKGCHLDAHMVEHALERLSPPEGSILFIENVGNLVCPAAFDLGEAEKVVVFSVTEGEDKPLKYPDMFSAAGLVLLNKVDLLPHLDFDVARAEEAVRRVNPKARVLPVSARDGAGLDAWVDWLLASRRRELAFPPASGQVA
jgi:hydrogenase nickel incorporation protein HypB